MSGSGSWWHSWALATIALVTLFLVSGGCPGPHTHKPLEDLILVAQTFRPLTREQVRSHLVIPSPYYVSLGFDPTVLDAMDIGHSKKKGKTIVPVYDGEACIGYVERSERPDCPRCKKSHDPRWDCRYGEIRWLNTKGFLKQQVLYNLANASQTKYHFIFLTPGAETVFRVQEAGFGAVSLLGSFISEVQIQKLAALGKCVYVPYEGDEASRENAVKVRGRLRANGVEAAVLPPPSGYKDFGSVKASEIVANLEARGQLDAYLEGQEAA